MLPLMMAVGVPLVSRLLRGSCVGFASPSSTGAALEANRRPAEELVKFHAYTWFDIGAFSAAYYHGLYDVTVVDAARLECAIAEISNVYRGRERYDQYYLLLRGMVGTCSLESFKCVYPHFEFPEEAAWITALLLVDCAESGGTELMDYLIYDVGGFEPAGFIQEVKIIAENNRSPRSCLEAVGLVADRSPQVAARKYEIYTAMLPAFLANEYGCADFEDLARKLVSLGAEVSDDLIEDVKYEFPDSTGLHEFLYNSVIPDCKEPEV
jgi:hypothetical protein